MSTSISYLSWKAFETIFKSLTSKSSVKLYKTENKIKIPNQCHFVPDIANYTSYDSILLKHINKVTYMSFRICFTLSLIPWLGLRESLCGINTSDQSSKVNWDCSFVFWPPRPRKYFNYNMCLTNGSGLFLDSCYILNYSIYFNFCISMKL